MKDLKQTAKIAAQGIIEVDEHRAEDLLEIARDAAEKEDDKYFFILKQHFKDDEIAFSKIHSHLNRNDELTKINGEHMSTIGKNLAEINTKMGIMTLTLNNHIEEVTPILKEYKQRKSAYEYLQEKGRWAVFVGSVIGAWYVIRSFFK